MIEVNQEEIKAIARHNINVFARIVGRDIFTLDFPDFYLALWNEVTRDLLSDDPSHRFLKIAMALPRGHAKTVFMKLLMAWIVLYTDRKYIMIIAASEPKAINIIADVMMLLGANNVRAIWGHYDGNISTDTKSLKNFYFCGRSIVFHAVGANGDPRGANINFMRPDVMLMDDIQSRECAKSEAESTNLADWFAATLLKAKSPTRCFYAFIGNVFPYSGTLLKMLCKDPAWKTFSVGALLADGTALWEALHSRDDLLKEFKADIRLGRPEVFMSELLNFDDATGLNTFNPSKLLRWDETKGDPIHRFIVVDLAGDKATSDNTAIGLFDCYYDAPVTPYGIKLIVGKMSPGEQAAKVLNLAIENNCRVIFVEAVAYQASFIFWLNAAIKLHPEIAESEFTVVPITPKNRAKNLRIAQFFKTVSAGGFGVTESFNLSLCAEAAYFDPRVTKNVDDVLDISAYAAEIPLQHVLPLYDIIEEVKFTKQPTTNLLGF